MRSQPGRDVSGSGAKTQRRGARSCVLNHWLSPLCASAPWREIALNESACQARHPFCGTDSLAPLSAFLLGFYCQTRLLAHVAVPIIPPHSAATVRAAVARLSWRGLPFQLSGCLSFSA